MATGIWTYSGTAASNTTISDISAAPGTMQVASLDNVQRQMAADSKNFATDSNGKLTSGGTANALTITTASGIPALADGVGFSFVASLSNTAAAAIVVDGLASKAIRKVTSGSTNDTALVANDIRANGHYTLRYDASANAAAGAWILLDPSTFSGAALITGFLNLDPVTYTIASDAITVTGSHAIVDTQGGAATDNLSTITGGSVGDLLIVRSAASARTVVVKHAVGNINLDSATDRTLNNFLDMLLLMRVSGTWVEVSFSSSSG